MTEPDLPATDHAIDEALDAPIRGWDFSWLEGRAVETPPPWDLASLVQEAASDADRLLDIDTGGGEFLERVVPVRASVFATEGYAPNVAVAEERLRRIGARIVHAASAPDNVDQRGTNPSESSSALPFSSGSFDLVLDRHSSYWPSEVVRVLRNGGRFLTQQRGEAGREGAAWETLFDRPPHAHRRFDLGFAVGQLAEAGFRITRAEAADTPVVFRDLAAVVYYLRLVPWAVDGFDPIQDRDALVDIERCIRADGELRVCGSQLLIDAIVDERPGRRVAQGDG